MPMIHATLVSIVVFLGAVHAEAQNDRSLVHETIVEASVGEVWDAFTTREGIESWMVPVGTIDLHIGGEMRTSYDPASSLHDDKTIVNRILSYLPQRMLSLQNVQAPAGVPFDAGLFADTWTVMTFEPIGAHRTRVRIEGLGYGDGGEWDQLYAFFDRGNASVLESLKQRFPSGSAGDDADAIMKDLRSLAGTWIHEHTEADGSLFRARSEIGLGPDGRSLITRGYLLGSEGMAWHGAAQIIHDPVTDDVRFQDINQSGWIARGQIKRDDEDALLWHWNVDTPDGDHHSFRVRMTIEGVDSWRFRLFAPSSETDWNELVNIVYERTGAVPHRFLTGAERNEANEQQQ